MPKKKASLSRGRQMQHIPVSTIRSQADSSKMAKSAEKTSARSAKFRNASQAFRDIAPALADYTDKVLFGDVWERPGLSPRDRSLITVATLIALYRTNELPFHLRKALENGVSREEIGEVITHLAFYAGWPTASTAVNIAQVVFNDSGSAQMRTSQ